jgi:hypothetical protein
MMMPLLRRSPDARSLFGDAAVVLFLLAQYLDGIFTYLGVLRFGVGVEANPLLASLMLSLGSGGAIVTAKVTAGILGMALHLGRVHRAVAALATLYIAAAVLPWTILLFG